VLTVNKMDRCFLELQLDAEEAFQNFLRVIENTNVCMATYQDDAMGDLQVRPAGGRGFLAQLPARRRAGQLARAAGSCRRGGRGRGAAPPQHACPVPVHAAA
jgi:hypothetical protein